MVMYTLELGLIFKSVPSKKKRFTPATLGAVNREHLLSDHRQHLHVDAVELVEAAPTAAAPLKNLAICYMAGIRLT